MEHKLLSLPQPKKPAVPVHTYVILLRNGKTIDQKATSWVEVSEEDGSGVSYNFYMDKIRILTMEYSIVEAVICSDFCDVESVIAAIRRPKRRRIKKA